PNDGDQDHSEDADDDHEYEDTEDADPAAAATGAVGGPDPWRCTDACSHGRPRLDPVDEVIQHGGRADVAVGLDGGGSQGAGLRRRDGVAGGPEALPGD